MLLSFATLALYAAALGAAAPDFHTLSKLPGVPRGWKQGAPAPSDAKMYLHLSVENKAALSQIEDELNRVSSPSNKDYGKWADSDKQKEMLKPAANTTAAVHSWLRSANAVDIDDQGAHMSFLISVQGAEKLLNTKFYTFSSTQANKHVIRALEYSVPAALAGHVSMVQPTTAFGPAGDSRGKPETLVGPHSKRQFGMVTPDFLRELYNVGDALAVNNPKNVIAVSGYLGQYASNEDLSEWISQFQSQDKSNTFSTIGLNHSTNDPSQPGAEASLDIDYAVGFPNATGVFISTGGEAPSLPDGDAPSQNEPYLAQLEYLLKLSSSELPTVLSTSYGEPEATVPTDYLENICSKFMQLSHRGVSVIFSSGDFGVGETCTVDGKIQFQPIFPAACPYVTSVGATSGSSPEQAVSFSSGGFSNYHKTPSYQKQAVDAFLDSLGSKYQGWYNAEGRGFPDVASQGINLAVVQGGEASGVSGTRYVSHSKSLLFIC